MYSVKIEADGQPGSNYPHLVVLVDDNAPGGGDEGRRAFFGATTMAEAELVRLAVTSALGAVTQLDGARNLRREVTR